MRPNTWGWAMCVYVPRAANSVTRNEASAICFSVSCSSPIVFGCLRAAWVARVSLMPQW